MSGEEKGTGTHIYSVLPMGLELGSVLRVNVAQGVKGERGEDSWRGKGGGCYFREGQEDPFYSRVIVSQNRTALEQASSN